MSIEKLESQLLETRNSLSTDRLDMSFGEIMSMYERKEIIIDPDFQRLFRWSRYQQTRFIESLLLGIPIPPIFVAEDKDGKWELVDGLQRLSTVLSFFSLLKTMSEKNGWALDQGDLVESLEGFNASTLPLKFQLNIKRSVCRIEIIKWNSKMDMRYELFNRLNTGGARLTDQEIRNCIFRGISSNFNDLLRALSKDVNFVKITDLTEKQKSELYNEELVLRFISLLEDWQDVKDNISNHMTKFMKKAVQEKDADFYDSVRFVFNKVFKLLSPLDRNIFRFDNGVLSTSLFDAITISLANNYEYYETQGSTFLRSKIDELKSSQTFRTFTGSAANSSSRVVNRIKIAKKIFDEK